ncbi:MAG TPA: class I SAM-dependent methyltransferase [Blastocatellia bacterium]|nr:class I SAM-dependent methyltransferase [Blastocatellia bacterium]
MIPTNIFERLGLWAGKVPVPAIDAIFSIMKARCIMAGVRLGIFEALRDGPLLAAEIAERCNLECECTEMLLRTLAFVDYLEFDDGRYSLSKISEKTMVSGGEFELVGFLQWNYTQWRMLEHLEELIQTGRGIDFHETMEDASEWAHYQRAMLELARFDAPVVAHRVPVRPGAKRLLDVAGSHGLIGAAICRRHPPMRSEVVDLSDAIEHARELAREQHIDDIVSHRVGDVRTDDFGVENDVVLLANILHHFTPEMNLDILNRAFRSMNEDGTIAIWEVEAPDKSRNPNEGDGGALFFRLTSNAGCYNGSQYEMWLKQAGFEQVEAQRPAIRIGSVLVIGRKRSQEPGARSQKSEVRSQKSEVRQWNYSSQ